MRFFQQDILRAFLLSQKPQKSRKSGICQSVKRRSLLILEYKDLMLTGLWVLNLFFVHANTQTH